MEDRIDIGHENRDTKPDTGTPEGLDALSILGSLERDFDTDGERVEALWEASLRLQEPLLSVAASWYEEGRDLRSWRVWLTASLGRPHTDALPDITELIRLHLVHDGYET